MWRVNTVEQEKYVLSIDWNYALAAVQSFFLFQLLGFLSIFARELVVPSCFQLQLGTYTDN